MGQPNWCNHHQARADGTVQVVGPWDVVLGASTVDGSKLHEFRSTNWHGIPARTQALHDFPSHASHLTLRSRQDWQEVLRARRVVPRRSMRCVVRWIASKRPQAGSLEAGKARQLENEPP